MRLITTSEDFTVRESRCFAAYLIDKRTHERFMRKSKKVFTEKENIATMLAGGEDAAAARERLIMDNLGFVITVAKHYGSAKVNLTDLISAGNIGLIKAADSITTPLYSKFTSYALPYVQRSILDELRYLLGPIYKPRSADNIGKILTEYNDLSRHLDEEVEFSYEGISQVVASLDAAFDEEGVTLLDTISGTDYSDTECINLDNHQQLEALLQIVLGSYETPIFMALFNLDGDFHTRLMLSEEYNISMNELERLEKRMLKKIQYSDYAQEIKVLIA